jgi:hypothetical protein
MHCQAEPTTAGLWFSPHGRTAWLAFACDNHSGDLIAPRPLLPRNRDALNRRRDKRRTELAGHRWAGEQEGRSPVEPPPRGSSSAQRRGLAGIRIVSRDAATAAPAFCLARSGTPGSAWLLSGGVPGGQVRQRAAVRPGSHGHARARLSAHAIRPASAVLCLAADAVAVYRPHDGGAASRRMTVASSDRPRFERWGWRVDLRRSRPRHLPTSHLPGRGLGVPAGLRTFT